jgi:hypothetical protein
MPHESPNGPILSEGVSVWAGFWIRADNGRFERLRLTSLRFEMCPHGFYDGIPPGQGLGGFEPCPSSGREEEHLFFEGPNSFTAVRCS